MEQKLINTHSPELCEGRGCSIHHPSDHHMKKWPLNWRGDTQVMERLCRHGVGHPDPDHMTYVKSMTPPHRCDDPDSCTYPHLEWQGVHGCDGCCRG